MRTFPASYEMVPFQASDEMFIWSSTPASALTTPGWCATAAMKRLLADAQATVSQLLPTTIPVPATFLYGTNLATYTSASGAPGKRTRFHQTSEGDSTVPVVSARGDGLTSGHSLVSLPIPYADHTTLYKDSSVHDVLTELLLRGQTPETHFVARFEQEKLCRGRSMNRLVVACTDSAGAVPPNASLTITFSTPRRRAVKVPITSIETRVDIRMPPPGSLLRCTVSVEAPSLPRPKQRTILLKAF
jgi:hypothetical protein